MQDLLAKIHQGPIKEAMELLPDRMNSDSAVAQLLKTGLQESRFIYRRQMVGNPPKPTGPAVSFWQFEQGGIRGVLTHTATRDHARKVCNARKVPFLVKPIWEAMQTDDVLGAAMARLNYWWVPTSIPAITDEEGSWRYYLSTWRPGAAKRQYSELRAKWGRNHKEVVNYMRDL